MPISKSLFEPAASMFRTIRDHRELARMGYTARERSSLRAAMQSGMKATTRSKAHETDLLGFPVSYLDPESFRYALREIFYECQYRFDAGTDAPVILDCGANIGLATLYFKRLCPAARILCFEADPTTASVLSKNIDRNHLKDVSVHNLMLSGSEGERQFFVDANNAGTLTMSGTAGRIGSQRGIQVKSGKLSSYIDGPVDLVKLDVEGAEFEVMDDLKTSGKLSQIRRMVIEYHHRIDGQPSRLAKFLALLEEAGFEYQLSAHCFPVSSRDAFQDVLIGVYRPRSNS